MAFDPYRILGLTPGASQLEIKRAYRQLAKAHHPDSAGAGEIQRFLTIQRAYEVLTTSSTRRWTRGARSTAAPTPAPGEPWRADPDRARATRERARRRPGGGDDGARGDGTSARTDTGSRPRAGGAGPSGGGSTGTAGPTAGADNARSNAGRGPSGPAEGAAEGHAGGRPRTRRRSTRKATFGSTTYDDAREQADATWHGASWYGPTLGEYWTVNPREYADPRKHGPEYLARARRPLGGPAGETGGPGAQEEVGPDAGTGVNGSEMDEGARDGARPWPPAAERRAEMGDRDEQVERVATRPIGPRGRSGPGAPSAAREAGRTRGSRAGARGAATSDEPAAGPAPGAWAARMPSPGAGTPAPWFGGFASELGGPRRRFLLAVIAWPPIGIALATAIGSATGCIDASATCTDASRMAPWLAQAAILGLLLALPTLGAILAAGSVTAVVASVPITALLVALGANYDPGHATIVLAVLLAVAWAVGVGIAIARRIRPRSGRPPVS